MTDYHARPDHGAAWVTGASSGIGRSIALKLADVGFTVVATARSREALEALAGEAAGRPGRIVAMHGDVGDADEMARIVSDIERDHGALALAIFNAGVYLPVHGEALAVSDFEKTVSVNLLGVVKGLVPAVETMKRARRGQIAIVSSVTGYGGLPTSAAYGATKAALINMAECLKFDFDKLGIRLQIVNPGFVDTPATEKNEFSMPALMQVDDAAARIVEGLGKRGFEITFPRRFTYVLKFLGLMPYGIYFALINRATGWSKRPLQPKGEPGE